MKGNCDIVETALMTLEEVAEYLRVQKCTIYVWVSKGKIPAFKVGRFWRFSKEGIDKWLEEHKNETQTKGSTEWRLINGQKDCF